ncbi:thiamine pyrophosphate-binding protein [Alkalihalobacillus sp. BA299]|uniref:thiamine pyrophosphate-binding protein n=1 Tax=Alkalihalobacillus sp. BA299 TaxID=2815938 RepID=UPI001ADB6473|nr:thiamine pyrophosphate-binding protein [Alkalihalobacillus sp. BA299]
MRLGEAIVKKLKVAGVDTAFGIPGGGTSSDLLCLMDEQNMKFVLTQNETTAAIMASVVGEVTKTPGICVTDLGPGALQMSTGLAYALLDRAPMIALTDRYGAQNVDYALRQKISHIEAFKPVTKLTSTISDNNWNHMLNRGFTVATTPNYGPVHFDVPNDLVKKEVSDENLTVNLFEQQMTADEKNLNKMKEKIKKANYPIAIVGLGINTGNGQQYERLKSFISKLQIPVYKTAKAKGTISDSDELSLGVFMGGKLEAKIMEKCDLIIAIGLDPVELLPKKWAYPQPIVSISHLPNVEEMYSPELEAIGDIGISLSLLESSVSDCSNRWTTQDVSNYREYVYRTLETDVEGLTANDVVLISQEILPRDVLMTTDVGASKLIVSQLWNADHPQSFFISNGLATMGFALPAAMALQHVYPHKMVASLTGDGGFMMRMNDIATAVQNEWPVIQIVFSDKRLSLMDVKQISKGYKSTNGNGFVAPDYVKFAESFGANGWCVETKDELRAALNDAIKMNNRMPRIIEAKINPDAYHGQFNAIREL